MWRLHAPPSREADINPNPKKGGYPAPDRVTFLTGANRDFPNWRRHMILGVLNQCPFLGEERKTSARAVFLSLTRRGHRCHKIGDRFVRLAADITEPTVT